MVWYQALLENRYISYYTCSPYHHTHSIVHGYHILRTIAFVWVRHPSPLFTPLLGAAAGVTCLCAQEVDRLRYHAMGRAAGKHQELIVQRY